MAEDKKIALEIEVKGTEQSIESVKDLKAAIKAAKDEQLKAAAAFGESSKEFIAASKNVSKLKDKVEDLADSTKSLKGSGVERASEGFNQLGEGLKNLDFDKVKVGLVAMKSALAAVGIGLIVQLVAYLIENFDELSQGTGILARVLQGVGAIITYVKDEITKLTDALGLTNSSLDKMGEATVKNAEKSTEALKAQTDEYDRQIAVAKASGKSAVDLEIAKQQAIIDTNKALIEQTIAYVKQGGVLDEEKKKLLTGQLETIKTAVATQNVITINAEKEKNDKLKALNDEAAKYKIDQDLIFKGQQAIDDEASYQLEVEKLAKLNLLKVTDQEQALLDKQAFNDQLLVLSAQRGEAELAQDKINEDKKKQLQQDTANAYLDIASASNDSMQSLSDAFFAVKNANLKKGSAAELKAAEQQFKINKALAISSAIISGIQGVVNALSAQSALPEPIATVLRVATAVGVGIAAVANVAKIASTKFNPGGGGGGGSAPTMPSAPPIPSHPTISTPENNTNKTTTFDETGKNLNAPVSAAPVIKVNATVGVDEITTKKDRVEVLEKQSTF